MKIAILYQKNPVPVIDGVIKPMKDGGYADSGADIAFSLKMNNLETIFHVKSPNMFIDLNWVFPDTKEGIQQLIDFRENMFWLNNVLYKNHPIQKFIEMGFHCGANSRSSRSLRC